MSIELFLIVSTLVLFIIFILEVLILSSKKKKKISVELVKNIGNVKQQVDN